MVLVGTEVLGLDGGTSTANKLEEEAEEELILEDCELVNAPATEADDEAVSEDCVLDVVPSLETEETVDDMVFARTQNTLVELDGPAGGD